jgi:hypothetical protein
MGVEIPAGSPREAELGEHQKLDPLSRGGVGQRHAGGGVMGRVGHLDGRSSGGDLDESVLHDILSFRHPREGASTQDIFYFIIAESERIIKCFGENYRRSTKLSSRFSITAGKSSYIRKRPHPAG